MNNQELGIKILKEYQEQGSVKCIITLLNKERPEPDKEMLERQENNIKGILRESTLYFQKAERLEKENAKLKAELEEYRKEKRPRLGSKQKIFLSEPIQYKKKRR